MAFDFPNSPTLNQTFTPAGGPTYTWNGTAWLLPAGGGGASVTISDTAPASPSNGSLWWESNSGQFWISYNDGNSTQWVQLNSVPGGMAGVLNVQVFTASGTYTPSAGMATAIIECVGGGGAGGGSGGSSGTNYVGAGGGSGGYSRRFVTAAQVGTSQTVTIGSGGVAVSNAAGGAGTATSLGSLCIANGGGGGGPCNASSIGQSGLGGSVTGAVGSITAAGNPGFSANTGPSYLWSTGASSALGGGVVISSLPGPGATASNYGAGGSGSFSNDGTVRAGGNGSPGIVVVTEYAAIQSPAVTASQSVTGTFVNKFRNGMMDIANRTASGTVGAGATGYNAYSLDGWYINCAGAGAAWSQQYNSNLVGNALRIACASALTTLSVLQRIESIWAVQLLNANKTAPVITIQFTIYNATGGTITPSMQVSIPTVKDNFSSLTVDTSPVLQSIPNGSIGTVAFSYTPSTSIQLGMQVSLNFAAQLAQASGYVDISYADIRATPGAALGLNGSPPPVEQRPASIEATINARYYGIYGTATGSNNAGGANGSVFFSAPMRVSPAVLNITSGYATSFAANGGYVYGSVAPSNCNVTVSAEL